MARYQPAEVLRWQRYDQYRFFWMADCVQHPDKWDVHKKMSRLRENEQYRYDLRIVQLCRDLALGR